MKFLISLFLLVLFGCQPKDEIKVLKGDIFGSYYLIKYVGDLKTSDFESELKIFFKKFNDEFSTYQKDSIISKFNVASSNDKFSVSPQFIELLKIAQTLHKETQGAFDPTLAPVIRLWGFGGGEKRQKSPKEKEIQETLKNVGFGYVKWDESQLKIWKSKDGIVLDVNAFAPGFAADLIGQMLEDRGIRNYMVDISGEFVVKGKKAKDSPWIVGIEKPAQDAKIVQAALTLNNEALATSGNYRQFFNDEGVRRSHIIDPRTGYPVTHQIASATVIASSAALADGWGTAMMVLGEEGIEIANRANVKVMLLRAKTQSDYQEIISDEFKTHLLPKR